ncbi:onchocystatin [Halyomorpha halys]|uniref:onchocystatin n=1 Tax=Halyomorpha halys TaxID=286706 RepID=UPI0006D51C31|nr:onchocystatin [Halyomorpha halys]
MSSEKHLMGGHKQRDPEDQEIKELLNKAVVIHNSKSNDENILVVKIVEVTSQVVAGMKYKLIFIGEGDTSKKQYNCVAEVLSQPWISPEPQLLSINFTPL